MREFPASDSQFVAEQFTELRRRESVCSEARRGAARRETKRDAARVGRKREDARG